MLLKTLEQEHEKFREEGREEAHAMFLKTLEQEHEKFREEGLLEGLTKSIVILLRSKFGEAGQQLVQEVAELHDTNALQETMETIVQASSLEQVKEFVATKKKSLHN